MDYKSRIKFLISSFLLSLLVFTVARIVFYVYHHSRFEGGLLPCLFYGLRFDTVAALALNGLFIFLAALPVSFFHFRPFRVGMKILFMLANAVGLLGNMVDVAYFPYTLRRSTADTISFFLEKNDAGTLLPVFLADFWHLVLLFVLVIWSMSWFYNRIQKKFLLPYAKEAFTLRTFSLRSLVFLVVMALSVLGIRGGTQLIPLSIIDAGNFVHPKYVPLVLNTPFCFIKSGTLYTLEEKGYMGEKEAIALFDPVKKYAYPDSAFRKKNIVVIIVESLSKEYTGLGRRTSYTSFLDSLMKNSLVFSNAFSNGKRSIEGIPAVLASMPSFQYDYISTVYSNNQITSLGNVLKAEGYTSSFFHGGSNGTMNFNGFCSTAGFDRYFGRNEYNNEKDYDGDWGIWDEPFLQRMVQELSKQKPPFVSAVFTLNSHHPYQVPEKYKGRFTEGTLPIHKCVKYADYCLQQFFSSARKQPWFNNTLFVITADHTGVSEDPFYANSAGNYEIPLLFYLPDNSLKGRDDLVAQQIDIMPTALSLLRYNKPFFAFGNNLTDSTRWDKRFAINYCNIFYQFYSNTEMLQFNGTTTIGLYNYRHDSLLTFNRYDKDIPVVNELSARLKAVVQQYNNRVIHNKTTAR